MAKKNDVEFVDDLPDDGRHKFPALLEEIRVASAGGNARWAVLEHYKNVASAQDSANRLRKLHPAFEFASRSKGDGTGALIYARFVGMSTVPDDE